MNKNVYSQPDLEKGPTVRKGRACTRLPGCFAMLAKSAFSLTLLIVMQVNAAEIVPELVGIQIGMPAAEATIVLQQRQLNVEKREATFPHSPGHSFPVSLKAFPAERDASKSKEVLDVYLATPPSEARVVGLYRLITYPLGAGPLPETIVEAMVEKFGEPVKKTNYAGETRLLWLWNTEGIPVQPTPDGICEFYLTALNYQGSMSGAPFTTNITADKFAKPVAAGCAAGVQATIKSATSNASVARYLSVAVDFQEADKVIRLTDEHMGQLQAEADKKAQKAAGAVKADI